jgi:hypothetical protein
VKLVAPNANGIVLLRQGRLVESLYRAPEQLLRGEAAIRAVEGAVMRGDGVLDIVSLAPDVVDGLHGVASGRPTYPELFASWVNAEGLVAFLREREFSGSMIVSSTEQSGVVMFEGGRVTGAFTSSNGELADHEGAVLALCGGPQTRIELRELEQAVKPARSEGVLADAVTALIEAP